MPADSAERPASPGGNTETARPRVPWFWTILLLALLIRVAWGLAVPVAPMSDAAAYETMALHLAAGHGLSLQPFTENPETVTPTAYWAVGTPAVYAACFAIFGHVYWPIVVLNTLVNLVTIALTMKLAARWVSPVHAAVAGGCLAVWPGQFMFVTIPASELLFTFGMVAAIFAWSRWSWSAWVRVPLVGVLLGLTCLVRPTALLFPILLVIISLTRGRGFVRPALHAVIASLIMMAVILPWSLRNHRILGEFVLVSANSGANLWMGNHPGTDGGYAALPPEAQGMSEVRRDAYLKQQARDYIKSDPVAFVRRTLVKAVKLHDRETINVLWNERGLAQRLGADAAGKLIGPMKLGSTAFWWVMCGGGLIGMLMLWIGGGIVRGLLVMLFHPAVVFWGYFLMVHAVIVIQDRYHWPSVPFIAMLASLPLVAVVRRRGRGPAGFASVSASNEAGATSPPAGHASPGAPA